MQTVYHRIDHLIEKLLSSSELIVSEYFNIILPLNVEWTEGNEKSKTTVYILCIIG